MENNHFVEPDLLAELKRKRDYISYDLTKDGILSSTLLSAIHEDASYHSKILEPDQAKRSKRIGRRKDFRQTRDELSEAMSYARKKFNGYITEPFLLDMAEKIEPKSQGIYRTGRVIIPDYSTDIPPQPEKVREQMNSLIDVVNDSSLDMVERALILHFHFLRIHPLTDGNGRTSRFVQNLMLAHGKYAPAIVPVGERSFYNSLIHEARRGFKERESDGVRRAPELIGIPPSYYSPEAAFYKYMASKINVGMDSIVDKFDELPYFRIDLKKPRDRSIAHGVKNQIQDYFRRTNSIGQARLINPHQGVVEVRGDISEDLLNKIVTTYHKIGHRISHLD